MCTKKNLLYGYEGRQQVGFEVRFDDFVMRTIVVLELYQDESCKLAGKGPIGTLVEDLLAVIIIISCFTPHTTSARLQNPIATGSDRVI